MRVTKETEKRGRERERSWRGGGSPKREAGFRPPTRCLFSNSPVMERHKASRKRKVLTSTRIAIGNGAGVWIGKRHHGNIPSYTQGQYWSLLNDHRLTPSPPNPRTPVVTPKAFQGLTNEDQAITEMLQVIIPNIPQLAQQPSSQSPATPLPQTRATPPQNKPPPMTRSADNLPHFSQGSDQAPSEDTTKRPEPTPSASIHNFPDPDTLSSDSTGSLREQLHLVNQRIDDAYRTLRMKDEHAEGPLRDSPFVQEIQNVPIPSHFHLSMLEAYDSSFDPTEHMAAFYVQMILYDTLDVIIC
ncbi:hypothetical protein GW17_00001890 [Ensete ventricosum]|nr:hypothetical protein GW17_00001890 [Ensete ventricosum]